MQITPLQCGTPDSTQVTQRLAGYFADNCPGISCLIGRVYKALDPYTHTNFVFTNLYRMGHKEGSSPFNRATLCRPEEGYRNQLVSARSWARIPLPDHCTAKNVTHFDPKQPSDFVEGPGAFKQLEDLVGPWFEEAKESVNTNKAIKTEWFLPRKEEKNLQMSVRCDKPVEHESGSPKFTAHCLLPTGTRVSLVVGDGLGTVIPDHAAPTYQGRGETVNAAVKDLADTVNSQYWAWLVNSTKEKEKWVRD